MMATAANAATGAVCGAARRWHASPPRGLPPGACVVAFLPQHPAEYGLVGVVYSTPDGTKVGAALWHRPGGLGDTIEGNEAEPVGCSQQGCDGGGAAAGGSSSRAGGSAREAPARAGHVCTDGGLRIGSYGPTNGSVCLLGRFSSAADAAQMCATAAGLLAGRRRDAEAMSGLRGPPPAVRCDSRDRGGGLDRSIHERPSQEDTTDMRRCGTSAVGPAVVASQPPSAPSSGPGRPADAPALHPAPVPTEEGSLLLSGDGLTPSADGALQAAVPSGSEKQAATAPGPAAAAAAPSSSPAAPRLLLTPLGCQRQQPPEPPLWPSPGVLREPSLHGDPAQPSTRGAGPAAPGAREGWLGPGGGSALRAVAGHPQARAAAIRLDAAQSTVPCCVSHLHGLETVERRVAGTQAAPAGRGPALCATPAGGPGALAATAREVLAPADPEPDAAARSKERGSAAAPDSTASPLTTPLRAPGAACSVALGSPALPGALTAAVTHVHRAYSPGFMLNSGVSNRGTAASCMDPLCVGGAAPGPAPPSSPATALHEARNTPVCQPMWRRPPPRRPLPPAHAPACPGHPAAHCASGMSPRGPTGAGDGAGMGWGGPREQTEGPSTGTGAACRALRSATESVQPCAEAERPHPASVVLRGLPVIACQRAGARGLGRLRLLHASRSWVHATMRAGDSSSAGCTTDPDPTSESPHSPASVGAAEGSVRACEDGAPRTLDLSACAQQAGDTRGNLRLRQQEQAASCRGLGASPILDTGGGSRIWALQLQDFGRGSSGCSRSSWSQAGTSSRCLEAAHEGPASAAAAAALTLQTLGRRCWRRPMESEAPADAAALLTDKAGGGTERRSFAPDVQWLAHPAKRKRW